MRWLKRCVSAAAVLLLAGAAVACGPGSEPETPEPRRVSALADTNFRQGFRLRGLNSVTDAGVVKVIDYGDNTLTPAWQMAQWWSKYNLKDGQETITDTDYVLEDQSKRVALKRNHGALTLGVKGSEEFASFNAGIPAQWPHLLIEQTFEGAWLKEADEVLVSLDFTLTENEDKRGGTLGLQAQFAWFIYVADSNPDSEGYGNFLWFGLNIFDSTKAYAPASAMQDMAGGPGNYIYTLGAETFLSARIRTGQNNRISYDILPHIDAALQKAQQSGFMLGTSVEDCRLTGMNIGWEVFDRWDVSITLFDIGIDLITYGQRG